MKRAIKWLEGIWPGRGDAVVQAYRDTFSTPPGERVLKDLAIYCGALAMPEPPAAGQMIDPIARAEANGRRMVFLHIAQVRGLTFDEVQRLMEIS